MNIAKLSTCAIVFITSHIEQTARYYHDVLVLQRDFHYYETFA